MNKGGRPIEYTQAHLNEAKKYLESCKDEERVRIKTEGDKSTTYEFGVTVKLPSIEGLARHLQKNGLHVYRQTLYDWRDRVPEFHDILEEILVEQAERLINRGMNGDYNGTIAKLLMGKHGYTDKSEVEQKTEHSFTEVSSEQIKKIATQALKNG